MIQCGHMLMLGLYVDNWDIPQKVQTIDHFSLSSRPSLRSMNERLQTALSLTLHCIGATPRCCGYYGEGSGLIRVRSVSCSGSETNITECSYLSLIVTNHQYDVGVQCQQG